MPAHSPTSENIKYGPNLETIQEIPSEEAPTGTTNRSAFFSPTNIAIALVGVGLVVTAYFSAPLAIAAICTLGLTGLAYGAAQYFGFFEESTSAQTDLGAGNDEANAHNAQEETNEHSSSFQRISEHLPPIEETQARKTPSPVTPSPIINEEIVEQPEQKRSDSPESQNSIISNNM